MRSPIDSYLQGILHLRKLVKSIYPRKIEEAVIFDVGLKPLYVNRMDELIEMFKQVEEEIKKITK